MTAPGKPLFQFGLRDSVWAVLVVGLAVGWWADRRQAFERAAVRAAPPQASLATAAPVKAKEECAFPLPDGEPIERDPQEAAIVAAVISLSHALGLRTVAEGIETIAQVDRLRALGCDLAQGFYFAKPGPAADVRP